MTDKKGILKNVSKSQTSQQKEDKTEDEKLLELTTIALAKTCYLNDKDDVIHIISQSQPAKAWINRLVKYESRKKRWMTEF